MAQRLAGSSFAKQTVQRRTRQDRLTRKQVTDIQVHTYNLTMHRQPPSFGAVARGSPRGGGWANPPPPCAAKNTIFTRISENAIAITSGETSSAFVATFLDLPKLPQTPLISALLLFRVLLLIRFPPLLPFAFPLSSLCFPPLSSL